MASRKPYHTPCTITVVHTWETLEAHVELDGGAQPEIGDRVTVHGAAVQVPFGETIKIRREATVRPASMFEKLWIRIQAFFELTELYEVSFSTGTLR